MQLLPLQRARSSGPTNFPRSGSQGSSATTRPWQRRLVDGHPSPSMDSSKPAYQPLRREEEDALESGGKISLQRDADDSGEDDEDFLLADDETRKLESARLRRRRLCQRWCYCCYPCCCNCSRRCLLVALFSLLAVIIVIGGGGFWAYRNAPEDGLSPPWYPTPKGGTDETWQRSYEKARQMVRRMSLVEKVNVTTGIGWSMGLCVGNTGPADSAGFPSLCLQDGPLGIRFADHSTAFPAGLTTGATWNRVLMYRRGAALGEEARLKGVNIQLGPVMGPMGRQPAGGRNWEGFGTDPVLQAAAAGATIRGIQDQGVMATAKHYVGNEQEHFRMPFEWGLPNALSSNIDDRTLHEVYIWPFADSVRAGVASVMCSYNMVNSSYACGNSKLVNGILKDELGFQGFVQSDWRAQQGGVSSALAGLDMSMPGDGLRWMDGESLWGRSLTLAVLNGSVPMERLDDMTTRIVAAWYQLGQDAWEQRGPNFSSWTKEKVGKIHQGASDSTETGVVNQFVDVQGNHSSLVRQMAAEGTVLVKNDGILPLDKYGKNTTASKKFRVAVVGDDAGPGKGLNYCVDRGCNEGTLAVGWGSGASEFPHLIDPLSALKATFNSKTVTVTSHLSNEITDTLESDLASQDLCIVFANSDSGEGYLSWSGVQGDRNDLSLHKGGEELILAVAGACGGTSIVVIHAVGPVDMESFAELDSISAILLANLPGEESGNALVDVLFGDVDASGRLPYTVGKSLEDYGPGAAVLYYPNAIVPQVNFDEGLYIDYRYFDKYNITPRYPFGYGLSYTTFKFSDLVITPLRSKSPLPAPRPPGILPPTYDTPVPDPKEAIFPKGFSKLKKYIYPYINSVSEIKKGKYPYPKGYSDTPHPLSPAGGGPGGNPSLFEPVLHVEVRVTNTGSRRGKEVVQIYVSFPSNVKDHGEDIDFPVKVLRGFEKVELEPGETTTVGVDLTRKDVSYWSVVEQNWVMPTEGEFAILPAKSASEIVLRGTW